MATGEDAPIRFRYIDAEGVSHDVIGSTGETLMAVAKNYLIRGIDGDCGGNCACGTCHIVVGRDILEKLPPYESAESELLAFIGYSPTQGHRLGCQIPVSKELEGAVITVASSS